MPQPPDVLSSFTLIAIRANPRLLFSYAAGGLFVSLGHGAMAWGAGGLLRAGFDANPVGVRSIPVALAFVGFGGSLLKMLGASAASWAEARLSSDASTRLLDHVARGWLDRGADRGGSADLARIVVSIRDVEISVGAGALAAGRAALQLVPLGIIALVVAPSLSLVALVLVTPFAIALSWARRRLHHRNQEALGGDADVHAHLDEMVRHVDLWRTYGSGDVVRGALWTRGLERGRLFASAAVRRAFTSSTNEVLGAALLVAAVVALPSMSIDPGAALTLIALLFLAYRPLRDFGDARGIWMRGKTAASWLAPWLGEIDPKRERGLATALFTAKEERQIPKEKRWSPAILRLDQFGAQRHDTRWSVTIEPGEVVAIVGPNGAGKTTLLRALLGLDAHEGALFYGDISLDLAKVGPGHRPFAWVPQEPPVIAGTLDENLGLGGRSANEARAELEALGGAALLRELEGAELGSSGRAISTGERAWIAIARAVGTGLPVLLLDEPTASLSPEAEERVLSLLRRIRGHRTVIVVTHRPAPAAIADKVLRLTSVTGSPRVVVG